MLLQTGKWSVNRKQRTGDIFSFQNDGIYKQLYSKPVLASLQPEIIINNLEKK